VRLEIYCHPGLWIEAAKKSKRVSTAITENARLFARPGSIHVRGAEGACNEATLASAEVLV